MRATDILKNEHRIIERVVDCLDVLAERAQTSGRLNAAAAGQALEFFQNFADGYHRLKEEHHLFRLMQTRGCPSGPPGVLHDEHLRGLKHLQAMAAFLPGAANGDADALEQFVALARTYVQLLREHMAKEEQHLFPMVDNALTEEDQAQLLRDIKWVARPEQDAMSYARWAEELAQRVDLPHSSTTCK